MLLCPCVAKYVYVCVYFGGRKSPWMRQGKSHHIAISLIVIILEAGWGGVGVAGVQMAPRFGHFQGVCDNSTSCLLQNKNSAECGVSPASPFS